MSRKLISWRSEPTPFLAFFNCGAWSQATSIMVIINLYKVSVRKGSSFCDRGRLNISRYLRDAVFSWRPVKLLIWSAYWKITIFLNKTIFSSRIYGWYGNSFSISIKQFAVSQLTEKKWIEIHLFWCRFEKIWLVLLSFLTFQFIKMKSALKKHMIAKPS